MAKESIKARNRKRQYLVDRYAAKRAQLKANKDYVALDKLPKNSSPTRVRNRCQITGRGRGYMRKFGISRLVFRDWASQGKLPGVTKVSW